MSEALSDAVLDALRRVGDPRLLQAASPQWARTSQPVGQESVIEYLDGPGKYSWLNPDDLDADRIEMASTLFARYGSEIAAALLLAALPETYAASVGSGILVELSELAEGGSDVLTRRVSATAQFLMDVMVAPSCTIVPHPDGNHQPSPAVQITRGLWGRGEHDGGVPNRALDAVIRLRLRHQALRLRATASDRKLTPDGEAIVNQEDLLGTLLTFSITVFEVLEQFGVLWTAEQQAAYLYAWDVVGNYLGIGDQAVLDRLPNDVKNDPSLSRARDRGNLRPQTVDEARHLLGQIRARVWSPSGTPSVVHRLNFKDRLDETRSGRMLVKALLDDVTDCMPPTRKAWPIRVVRQLAPGTVRERLGLGGADRFDRWQDYLPANRAVIGQFTYVDVPNRAGAMRLRRMATEVTGRYVGRLLADGLVIPGLPLGTRWDPVAEAKDVARLHAARATIRSRSRQ